MTKAIPTQDNTEAVPAFDFEARGVKENAIGSKSVQAALEVSVRSNSPRQKKLLKHIKRGGQAIKEHKYAEAGREGLAALDIDDKNPIALHVTAIAMDKLNSVPLALKLYLQALEVAPDDHEIYQNLGMLCWRIRKLDQAEKFFRLQIQVEPNSEHGPNNLGCILRELTRFDEAIEVLRSGLYIHPESALLWTSLGSTLVEASRFDEALTFHKEAYRLNPSDSRVSHNIGYTYSAINKDQEAIEWFERALELGTLNPADTITCRHARSISMLSLGMIDVAWKAYENRNHPQNANYLHHEIKLPLWDGETSLQGKRILLMGEQGLGDEILFSSVLPDLLEHVGPSGKLGLGISQRLVPLFKRSFPEIEVVHHKTGEYKSHQVRLLPDFDSYDDYDMWTYLASPNQILRTDMASFDRQPKEGFLRPDPNRISHWTKVLDEIAPGPRYGILWKSKLMTGNRLKFFAAKDLWGQTLQVEGCSFINLQYGDTEEDLKHFKDKFGVNLITPPDIDLMNDLDDLAALCCAMDAVVGPMNATTNIAAACGAPTWLVIGHNSWNMMNTGRIPYYPASTPFASGEALDWHQSMKKLKQHFIEDITGKTSQVA